MTDWTRLTGPTFPCCEFWLKYVAPRTLVGRGGDLPWAWNGVLVALRCRCSVRRPPNRDVGMTQETRGPGEIVCPGCSRPLCNWMGSGLVFKINAGRIVVKWGEKSQISMVPRFSQSLPARLNQRACSWNTADWETEVGLSRALWLWRESAAWHKRRTAKRRLERQERKLSASLFIKKEVGLRIIWIGLGWMEFLLFRLSLEG